jgi:hypothetical protein
LGALSMLHTKPLYLFDVSPGLIRFNGRFQSADQAWPFRLSLKR